jgi:hypothetical protein
MFVEVDFQQTVTDIKKRNLCYKALIEIKDIAEESSSSHDLAKCQQQLQSILQKCEQALEDVT